MRFHNVAVNDNSGIFCVSAEYPGFLGVEYMRKIERLALLLLLFTSAVFWQDFEVQAEGNAHALIITRGDYDDRGSNLSPGPENDGKNFERILNQAYGDSLTVTVLEKEGAETVAEVVEAVQTAFADSDSSDMNYFYYSGHGGEEGMWLGGYEFLSAEDLAQAFLEIRGTNFLVIDCCYSGNLISRSAVQTSFASDFVSKCKASLEKSPFRSAITNANFHVMVASSEGQESVQTGLGLHGEAMGFFTAAVSAGCGIDFSKVSSGEDYRCAAMADRNRDGEITFEELYAYVSHVLFASDAAVYPEQDKTVFLTVADGQIPDTAVSDVRTGYDADGRVYLEAEYQSGNDGILQGALYQCRTEEELWHMLCMSVQPEVTDYPYAQLVQAGSWEFQADAGSSRAELPLSAGRLEAGEYFLLMNEKEGNTGCYVFPVILEKRAEPKRMDNLTVQVKDRFSIEEEGELEITVDFGSSPYSNQYACEVSCTITNQSGQMVRSYAMREIRTEFSDGNYQRSCVFLWDGKKSNGKQVVAGKYTIDILASYGGAKQTRSQSVQVESRAVSDRDSIEGRSILLSAAQFVYDGGAKCPEVSIEGLQNGRDFTVAYENNRNAGRGIVRIFGTGNYSGTMVREFVILPMHVSVLDFRVQNQVFYTGKQQKAFVKASYDNRVLIEGLDYHLVYSHNRKPGYGKVKIQGIGNYTGVISRRFKILPAAPKTKKAVKFGDGTWKLSWKKSSAVNGYEVQYGTDKRFRKGITKRNVAGAKKTRLTVKVSSGDGKYYFRIRSYKKIGGKKWYSKFHVFS